MSGQIVTRLTDEELQELDAAADAAGLTDRSEVVRAALATFLREVREQQRIAARERALRTQDEPLYEPERGKGNVDALERLRDIARESLGIVLAPDTTEAVERRIFGDVGRSAVQEEADVWCRQWLGSRIVKTLFAEANAGVTFGVALEDGRRVVLKIHQPDRSVEFLEAVQRIQSRLHLDGFPAPRPLVGPKPIGLGNCIAEDLVAVGDYADARTPGVRFAMAAALHEQIELCKGYWRVEPLAEGWRLLAGSGVWPQAAHSPIFDFEASAKGAGWIEEHAAKAKPLALEVTAPPVVGHDDWRSKHLRFKSGAIQVVYDWDSLTIDTEQKIVGTAAAMYIANPHISREMAPSPAEASAFVEDYVSARGRPFSKDERETVGAVTQYVIAYVARCEHSLGGTPEQGFSKALAQHAGEYLKI